MKFKKTFTAEGKISTRQKWLAWFCIFLQIVPPLSGLFAAATAFATEQHMLPRSAVGTEAPAANPFEQQLANGAVTLGSALSDDDRSYAKALSDYARSQAGSIVNSKVEGWFSQFGTVRAQIGLDDDFSLSDSSLDMLVPLYDSKKQMLFTQFGARHKDDRNTINLGIGGRIFPTDNWMLGVNTFFDNDITGHNYRMGIGGEAWTDYLKLSANSYQRLNGWHQSRDFDDYDERPANGYDLRVNGFLPAYPQLGAKLIYEQYFGQDVALFGKDERQKDPYAVTVGVNYTPVPMLTIGADQRLGKSGKDDFNLSIEINYQLDKSWADNASPEAVDALRKLSRSRYDLVERNNNIILEYRKQQVIRMNLAPSRITGEGGTVHNLTAQVSAKHGLKGVTWSGASFTAVGGEITSLDSRHFLVTLPQYQVAQQAPHNETGSDATRILNTYVVTAVAEDTKGNKSSPTQLTIEVLPPQIHFAGPASIVNDNAPPDGTTPIKVLYRVVDGNKKAAANEEVTYAVTFADGSRGTQSVSSDQNGEAPLMLTSTVAGEAQIVAQLSGGENSRTTVHYADSYLDPAHSSLSASPASLVADGSEKSTLTLTAQDSLSRPVSGLDSLDFALSGVSGTTLSEVSEARPGEYVATLSGTQAGEVIVTPTLDGKAVPGLRATIHLTSDNGSSRIAAGDMTVAADNALADGVSQNRVTVRVTDAQGNPVAGQAVQFSATHGATIAATATTDDEGMISLPLTSLSAGVVTVTATVNGQTQQVDVTFIADHDSAGIASGDLTVLDDNAPADGVAENRIMLSPMVRPRIRFR